MERIPLVTGTWNAVPAATHDHAVRTLAVDHALEHMRQDPGQRDAKQHLVGFAFELRCAPAQTAIEPKQRDRTEHDFFISKPSKNLCGLLGHGRCGTGDSAADFEISP
jgi:hypothetical protein